MIIKYKDGPISKNINWLDSIKDARDPETLTNLYIQNLKEELTIVESQNKKLQQQLGIYDYSKRNKLHKFNPSQINTNPIKKEPIPLTKPSDFAKYPTHQIRDKIQIDNQVYGSSALKKEYITELETIIEVIKKQNKQFEDQLIKKKQQSKKQIIKKYEGYDMIDKQIYRTQSANRVNKKKQQEIKPDNTLQDRLIQNLMEEKLLLEEEIKLYKESKSTREKKSKMEGHDFKQHMKIYDSNTVKYETEKKYAQDMKDMKAKEAIEEKYLKALMQETFLLQQQLQKLKEENQYYNPKYQQNSVQGIVICNNDGQIIRSTYGNDSKEGANIARTIPTLAASAKSTVRDLDSTNELTFLRIKSKNNEIMVAPDKDFLLIVVQGPKEEKKDEQEQQ